MELLNILWRLIKNLGILAACGIALVLWYALWFGISILMGAALSLPLPWTKILLWLAPPDIREKMLDAMQAELDKQNNKEEDKEENNKEATPASEP